ncbi:propanediol utilization protein [Actibacterium ureilyticum]|uniref:propanediol utilization protein n=1 Tax=Actibacterium ureilyticum TaxID=1590614 RepID=UPI001594F223|nr:propanediol utilization protein [Actibacterium ureilyticum]
MPRLSPHKAHAPGHFGELLQGRLGAGGPVALVTLPCPALRATARRVPARDLRLHAPGRVLTLPVLRRFLRALDVPVRGRFTLHTDMPPGGGAGASTAALVAIARLVTPDCAPLELARACLMVEGATDPLMLPGPARVLWASRHAQPLRALPALPRFDVLGGFYGPTRRTDPGCTDFPQIDDLVPHWCAAARAGDLGTLAALASTSARRRLSQLGLAGDPTEALAQALGAKGMVIAHTGAARGLIFAPGAIPADGPARLRAAGFRGILQFRAGGA